MILKQFCMENFRGITKLELELDRTIVLIGENNTGKSCVLEALYTCMNRGLSRRATPFTEYDFHLATEDADPADALPLVLTLTFEESKKDEWPDEIVQMFPNVMQTLDDDRQRLMFRVSAKYDRSPATRPGVSSQRRSRCLPPFPREVAVLGSIHKEPGD